MKALAFKQPWAHAALYLGKGIDNRSRKDGRLPNECRHRGPLLIHASASETNAYYRWSSDWVQSNLPDKAHLPPHIVSRSDHERFPRGGIVGRCTVIAHVDPKGDIYDQASVDPAHLGVDVRDPWPANDPRRERHGIDMRWHMKGSYGLVIVDRERLPLIAWKGAQGLFNVPAFAVFARAPRPRDRRCPVCEGWRLKPSDTEQACVNCHGSGVAPSVAEAIARAPAGPLRILFLDIDGVLNESRFLHDVAAQEGGKIIGAGEWDPRSHLDPTRIARLNAILSRTGAKVVVSSSWRCAFDLAKLRELLCARGFVGDIIDSTPRLHGHERHVEIRRWLGARADDPRFVILDDDQDAGVGFDHRYIQIVDGLEDEHVELAVRILS